MVDERITQYIKKTRASGYEDDAIKARLSQSGLSPEEIEQSFSLVDTDAPQLPKPKPLAPALKEEKPTPQEEETQTPSNKNLLQAPDTEQQEAAATLTPPPSQQPKKETSQPKTPSTQETPRKEHEIPKENDPQQPSTKKASAQPTPQPTPQEPKKPINKRYAGFWIRTAAYAIDYIILVVLVSIVMFTTFALTGGADTIPPAALIALVAIVFGFAAYEVFATASTWQGTLGKHLLGLRVEDAHGARLSSAQSFLRLLSKYFLSVAWIVVAFTKNKQGVHDMIAKSYVVRG